MKNLEQKIYTKLGIEVRIEERPEGAFSIWYNDIILVDYCNEDNIEKIKPTIEIARDRKVISTAVGTNRVIIDMEDEISIAFTYPRKESEFNIVYLETAAEFLDKALKR